MLDTNMSNMELNKSTLKPKKGHQKDTYQGQIDPNTKLRHGTGTYHYPNKFFKYTGQYKKGVKHGKGTFQLGDGRKITGQFNNGQLCGPAQIQYPDQSSYKGFVESGQKHGHGIYKSEFQTYDGQWLNNQKSGKGTLQTSLFKIIGHFQKDKPHGSCALTKYAYSYQGQFQSGLKCGKGVQTDSSYQNSYTYRGQFSNDVFEGQGYFSYKSPNGLQGYQYQGNFKQGFPSLFANQYKIQTSQTKKSAQNQQQTEIEKTVITKETSTLEYELQTDCINIYVDSVYQGPQQLDPIQPTPEEIQQLVKNWQNQNKKNKNPPPMPDFNQPKMKKPQLVLIQQESKRSIQVKLLKLDGENEIAMKVDYRQAIVDKRKQNQELKSQAAKKAQQEGGKKGGKKDAKGGQPQLKINLFIQNAEKQCQQAINIPNQKGIAVLTKYQLPDDFPPGKYIISISSPFTKFGEIPQRRIQFTVKSKQPAKKK